MPAELAELQQLKAYANAMRQLIEAIEARYKLPEQPLPQNSAPVARPTRIP